MFQLLLATFLGGAIGLEREYKRKEAGLRTYALVCLATTLFTIMAFESFKGVSGKLGVSFDPGRIVQALAIGVGFLAAGLIVHRKFYIEGLTTATGLWVVAAIGIAIGLEFYLTAIFAAFVAIGILAGLRLVEIKILGKKSLKESSD